MVMPFHCRLAELFTIQRKRPLTDPEAVEFSHCLAANARYCWDLVSLANLSQVAYEAGDMEWLHEICAQIDALNLNGENIKKPGRHKGSTDK